MSKSKLKCPENLMAVAFFLVRS